MHDHPLSSVDRLVEFGLSMGVAQIMVNQMNQALTSAYTPGTSAPAAPAAPPGYFVALGGKQAGPFGESELSRLILEQQINATTLVWRPGLPGWRAASDVPEVLRLVMLCPPPLPKE